MANRFTPAMSASEHRPGRLPAAITLMGLVVCACGAGADTTDGVGAGGVGGGSTGVGASAAGIGSELAGGAGASSAGGTTTGGGGSAAIGGAGAGAAVGGGDVGASGANVGTEPVIVLEDRHDYSFSSTFAVETVAVSANSDITFDWGGITQDMLGQPFDPLSSVDMMELMVWEYAEDDLVRDLGNDELDTSNLVALGQVPTENAMTSATLLDIRSPSGGEIEPAELLEFVDPAMYSPTEYSYSIMLASGSKFGQGTKMLALFRPDPAETNTVVVLSDTTTRLDYEADLTSLEPVDIPPGTAGVVLDWSDDLKLTTTAMGKEWVATRITDVQVAHYVAKTPTDLETEFLDLEVIADELFEITLSAGQSVSLSRLTDASGAAFTGIDDVGTWIVALKCGKCANPAPLFLTVLRASP